MHKTTFGFTTKANGIVRELVNEIYISEAYDPSTLTPNTTHPVKKPYKAIWDTGATNTVVCRRVVQELNLQPSGRVTCEAVGSGDQIHQYETDTYLVNIFLPNRVAIIGIKVSEGSVGGGDVLLGMDIIVNGDFAVTSYNGQTWWTFRIPSAESIDFGKDLQEQRDLYAPKEVNPQFQKWLAQDRRKKGMRKKKR